MYKRQRLLDRFANDIGGGGAITISQDTDTPNSTFPNSMKMVVATADSSIAAADAYRFTYSVEGKDIATVGLGNSDCQTMTLTFWVRSSVTGTYGIGFQNSAETENYVDEYAISSANTWEKKVITITPTAGSTSFITASAGAIANDNGIGFELSFGLGQGSNFAIGTSNTWSNNTSTFASTNQVNWMDNTSNNFYLTQVQLEVGNLTDFEHRSVTEELALCQRYFFQESTNADDIGGIFGVANGTVRIQISHGMPVQMRAKPSLTLTSASIRVGDTVAQGVNTTSGTISASGYTGTQRIGYSLGGFTGLSNYRTYLTEPRTSDSMIGIPKFNAEL